MQEIHRAFGRVRAAMRGGDQETRSSAEARQDFDPLRVRVKTAHISYESGQPLLLKLRGMVTEDSALPDKVSEDANKYIDVVLTRSQLLGLLNTLINVNNNPEFQASGQYNRFGLRTDYGGVFGSYKFF